MVERLDVWVSARPGVERGGLENGAKVETYTN